MRKCPAPNCGTEIPRELAFCKSHWVRVPSNTRISIWAAYRKRDWKVWETHMESAIRSLKPALAPSITPRGTCP